MKDYHPASIRATDRIMRAVEMVPMMDEINDVLRDCRRVIAVAVNEGLGGFTKDERADIIENHISIKRIDVLLARLRSERAGKVTANELFDLASTLSRAAAEEARP